MAPDQASSLKADQLSAVSKMLAFNVATVPEDPQSSTSTSPGEATADLDSYSALPRGAPAGTAHNQWKILIYDKTCRSIISPLLSVSNLRRRGVTLHLLIDTEREPIPDVPAIYFVEPTRANISIIAHDCSVGLYKSAHLNFVTRIERTLLEEFARLVVQANCVKKVVSVYDQYLDYVCLEQNLFTLNTPNSYILYNDPNTTEGQMDRAMGDIANGLLSVVATTGQLPVVRCARGGAPEMVARKLMAMIADRPVLRELGRGAGSSAASGSGISHRRPLLVILERNSDLITPVQHTSTYQALIDDLLVHNANRVEFNTTVEENGGRTKVIPKRFDLNADKDQFYSRHKFSPFPEAIESNGAELQDVTDKTDEIRSKTVTGSAETTNTIDVDLLSSTGTADLATAVDSLPLLMERKRQLEVHTSILQAVMTEVASRDIPQFYELESSLATGVYKNDLSKAKRDVLELVTDRSKGSVSDKVRLLIVYCLATTAPGGDIDDVANKMREIFDGNGIQSAGTILLERDDRDKLTQGLSAIDYLKRLRSMNMISTMADQFSTVEESTYSAGSRMSGDMLSTLMKSATNQATGLLAKATERVSSMLGKVHKHHVTFVVENIVNQRPGTEDDEYLYFDPRISGEIDQDQLRSTARAPVNTVIAFVVGGGCYQEWSSLSTASLPSGCSVIYGATDIVDPTNFLNQLSRLA